MKYLCFVILLIVFSCNTEHTPKNLPNINQTFYSFHTDLFTTPLDSINSKIPWWIQHHSPFFELFCSHVIKIGFPEEKRFPVLLQSFVADFRMQKVFHDITQQYPNLEPYNKEINEAFRFLSYYFPHWTIPKVYYYHGGFNQSIIATDSILGIGLDKYLGTHYEYYSKLALPMYMRQKMTSDYIAIDALRFYISGLFPFPFEQDHVLSRMIYEGEIQYILKKIFPDKHDTLLFGFSETQLIWCEKSERSMWRFLIDKKKLFSSDLLEIKRYINDGPFTTTFPRESPARAAVWIGYRIVSQFMDKHPEISLNQLTQITDFQYIVQNSAYDP
ncbi:MAG: hypothetical protein N2449_06655 [Bacteroidales bacterium]|nr:hypothetical protein [Bacteroidales bacterium]